MATATGRPGRGSDQYVVRFPDGMRELLRKQAVANHRSMNGEIVHRLERSISMEEKGAAEGATSPRHDHNPSLQGNGNEYAD